jgi:hypothetical protein
VPHVIWQKRVLSASDTRARRAGRDQYYNTDICKHDPSPDATKRISYTPFVRSSFRTKGSTTVQKKSILSAGKSIKVCCLEEPTPIVRLLWLEDARKRFDTALMLGTLPAELTWVWLEGELSKKVPLGTPEEMKIWPTWRHNDWWCPEEITHPNARYVWEWQAATEDSRLPPPPPYLPTSHDPYVVLGIPHTISGKDIKAAFKRLAKIHHPDTGGSAENFMRLKTAYDSLKYLVELEYV